MTYHYTNNEANFGSPVPDQVPGGAHITLEIILKHGGEYVALRRPNGIPGHKLPPSAVEHSDGLLYFCHNLIRYGESDEDAVERIVGTQAGVGVKHARTVYIDSVVQDKDDQWAFTPHVIAEVAQPPKASDEVTEVVTFTLENIPANFGWWDGEELKEFLREYDK